MSVILIWGGRAFTNNTELISKLFEIFGIVVFSETLIVLFIVVFEEMFLFVTSSLEKA